MGFAVVNHLGTGGLGLGGGGSVSFGTVTTVAAGRDFTTADATPGTVLDLEDDMTTAVGFLPPRPIVVRNRQAGAKTLTLPNGTVSVHQYEMIELVWEDADTVIAYPLDYIIPE